MKSNQRNDKLELYCTFWTKSLLAVGLKTIRKSLDSTSALLFHLIILASHVFHVGLAPRKMFRLIECHALCRFTRSDIYLTLQLLQTSQWCSCLEVFQHVKWVKIVSILDMVNNPSDWMTSVASTCLKYAVKLSLPIQLSVGCQRDLPCRS